MAELSSSRYDPVTGLIVALALVPLTWPFGFEQIVPPLFLLCWALLYVATRRPRLYLEARLLLLFLVVALGSATVLAGLTDWVRWFRGVFTIMAGIGALVLASGIEVRNGDLRRLSRTAVLFLLGLGLLGVLVSTGAVPLSFGVPFPQPFHLIPGWESSGLVSDHLLDRNIAIVENRRGASLSALWFDLPRFSGTFLIHGYLSTAVLVFLAWTLAGWDRYSLRWRRIACAALLSGFFVLVLAGSRTALLLYIMMVVVLGGWRVLVGRFRRRTVVPVLAGAAVVAVLAAVAPLPGGNLWHRVFVDIRPGSLASRVDVYERTIQDIAARPVFGWGNVPRHPEEFQGLATGTHSEPLNIVYRFGLAGGAVYLAAWGVVLLAVVRQSWRVRGHNHAVATPTIAIALGAGAVVVHSLSHTLTPDANAYWLFAALAGTARASIAAAAVGRHVTPSGREV